jgi:ferritin-like metal-binding protein YciE
MSTITTLEELFVEQLQDLYNAENQLIKENRRNGGAKSLPSLRKNVNPLASRGSSFEMLANQ